MANFAEINLLNKVINLIVVDDNDIINNGGHGSEQAAIYVTNKFKLSSEGVKWIESPKLNEFRKQSASIGGFYDSQKDIFLGPKPYASWSLDENNNWKAPIDKPNKNTWGQNNDPILISWNEDNQKWVGKAYSETGITQLEWDLNSLSWTSI